MLIKAKFVNSAQKIYAAKNLISALQHILFV